MIATKPRPLGVNVLILQDVPKTVVNGVVMPDNAEEKPSKGVVESVGRLVLELKPGDRVTLSQYLGTEFVEDGKTYLLAKEDHVLIVHDPIVCSLT